MNKSYYFFIILLILVILVLNLPFISSNFVCGFVNNSEKFSSSWIKVIIYPEENPLKFIGCKVNPENKFCCDLEEILSFNPTVGKKIFAEIFDSESGLVAGPVSLFLTGEGYDVFPEMILQKAITINSPNERIFINKSSIQINLSLADKYNNLKYTLNSSSGFFEEQVCNNCSNPVFSVPLAKGKNELKFIAYNEKRNISEETSFYNLNYLNFKLDVVCGKCKIIREKFYVPSGKNITIFSSFNSSHNISGDFLFYFPSDWVLNNYSNTEDFSLTHNILSENIFEKKEFTVNYTFRSPDTFFKKEYTFYQMIDNKESSTKIRVYKLRLIPFHKLMSFEEGYFNADLIQKGSLDEPIVFYPKKEYINLVAIFPKKEIFKAYSNLKFDIEKNKRNETYSFSILTSISQKDIEKIFLMFKVEKGKSIEVYNSDKNKINLEFYKEDSNYIYYTVFVSEKGPFKLIIF